jgi:hypothetical protein
MEKCKFSEQFKENLMTAIFEFGSSYKDEYNETCNYFEFSGSLYIDSDILGLLQDSIDEDERKATEKLLNTFLYYKGKRTDENYYYDMHMSFKRTIEALSFSINCKN